MAYGTRCDDLQLEIAANERIVQPPRDDLTEMP
jgi:hypothetical protein